MIKVKFQGWFKCDWCEYEGYFKIKETQINKT